MGVENSEQAAQTLWRAIWRLVRHRWHDAFGRSAIPAPALQRLGAHVAASELQHTGQIRIVVEKGLPWSYLRRHAKARERALMLFSKHRVWDTAHNNGVLIYLLMPEHAFEIVADRGLARHVPPAVWKEMAAQMSARFQQGRYEDGLAQAVDAVGALLAQHFPRTADSSSANELPDTPVVR
ncbi:TPM domain-containing protein [Acidovorax sp. D2M1]|uniref:TPM domain-containing protein n=1 Tax=Acidovorax benzenivorans TaxID=2987520 RepID=A0ABT5S432_9BURK|nr:TPM domain-containing protein [Acidovorax benzenivorans]MDD2180724.1 TPM domain-containing protein [Acidovorax benzenivorans]